MECTAHPGVMAATRCEGCAEPFCDNCLVDVQGQRYCGACKVMALQGKAPAVAATTTCKDAKSALFMSIIGLFLFGIILEPMAIMKANAAKKQIAEDPTLGGSGMATAAMVIAIIGLALWVLGLVARISQIANA